MIDRSSVGGTLILRCFADSGSERRNRQLLASFFKLLSIFFTVFVCEAVIGCLEWHTTFTVSATVLLNLQDNHNVFQWMLYY